MRLSAFAACLALVALCASSAEARVERNVVAASFHSVALRGTVHALVFLPPGYPGAGTRYPVVYFLHGLPAGSSAYTGNKWLADSLQAVEKPAILVEPQGSRGGDSDPEYLNWGAGRNWESFITGELVSYVDHHFRTIPTREGRGLVGLSAGGYGAVILGVHHLDAFGAIESWSGYFHPTNPEGTGALDRGPDADAHVQLKVLAADVRRRPTFLGFYVGKSDARFEAENVQFDRELTAARVPHLFALYPGGHQTSLWQAHAEPWLAAVLAHLEPAHDATVP